MPTFNRDRHSTRRRSRRPKHRRRATSQHIPVTSTSQHDVPTSDLDCNEGVTMKRPTQPRHLFSEDTMQRQLNYLLPTDANEAYLDDLAYATNECCFHGHGEGYCRQIICCGLSCGLWGGWEKGFLEGEYRCGDNGQVQGHEGGDIGVEEEISSTELAIERHGLIDRSGSEEEIQGAEMRKCNWECGFCGSECFCWTVDEEDIMMA